MPEPLTLQERYYKINEALNNFFESQSLDCRVLKYGIDPATTKDNTNLQEKKYPYFQSFLLNPKPQSWTDQQSGTYYEFEYQLSFFTSPRNETEDDIDEMRPFEIARIALCDIDLDLLRIDPDDPSSGTYATVLDVKTPLSFKMVSGAVVPSGVLLVKMAAVVSYPITLPVVGDATNIDNAIVITENGD